MSRLLTYGQRWKIKKKKKMKKKRKSLSWMLMMVYAFSVLRNHKEFYCILHFLNIVCMMNYRNLKHMREKHGFFIPDASYCVNSVFDIV